MFHDFHGIKIKRREGVFHNLEASIVVLVVFSWSLLVFSVSFFLFSFAFLFSFLVSFLFFGRDFKIPFIRVWNMAIMNYQLVCRPFSKWKIPKFMVVFSQRIAFFSGHLQSLKGVIYALQALEIKSSKMLYQNKANSTQIQGAWSWSSFFKTI